MGTSCAPPPYFVADILLFCNETDVMRSLAEEKQNDMNDTFNFKIPERFSYYR